MKILCPLFVQATRNPKADAVISEDVRVDYSQLDNLVTHTAGKMRSWGVKKNTRVVIVGENTISCIVTLFASWRIGAIAALISNKYPPPRLLSLIDNIKGDRIITDKDHTLSKAPGYEVLRFKDLVNPDEAGNMPPEIEKHYIELNDHATIMYTSGSASGEKGALHSYANHYYNAKGSNENIPLGAGDRWLLSLPLYHVGGLSILFRCMFSGAAIVIHNREKALLESIDRHRVTHVSLVLPQLNDLIAAGRAFDGTPLKAALLGGSHFPDTLIKDAVKMKLPVYRTYGCTEMASQVATTSPHEEFRHLFSSGRVLRYRKVKIYKDGEIGLAGRTLFKAYVEKGKIRLFGNEWFRSGDIGYFDTQGFLRILGRRDNMFISGGENIQPERIESALNTIAIVREALVVKTPDKRYGYRPVAFIKFKSNKKMNKEQLNRALLKLLPGFNRPDRYYLWPEGISGGFK
ncbi:MAG: o-succinylbenzoate--CoA ligase, partial [Endomicrobiales bacterium]